MLKSSMFGDMPLDNRTVVQIAAQTAVTSIIRPFQTLSQAYDLMFRRDSQFCNIEPKIRQYD